jgi:hypothetical protein
MPNQYAKVKNAVKGEEEIQDVTDYGYSLQQPIHDDLNFGKENVA